MVPNKPTTRKAITTAVIQPITLIPRSGWRFYAASVLFGALVLTGVAWFIVAPLRGQPLAAGGIPARMVIGPLVNGAWGLGLALLLDLLDRALPGKARALRHGWTSV
jgi:hypothetical protein